MRPKLTRDGAIDAMLAGDIFTYWTLDGAKALLDYLEAVDATRGVATDYRAAVLPGHWAEYESAEEAARSHGWRPDSDDTTNEQEAAAHRWLGRRYNAIIQFHRGVVVGNYR